MLPVSGNVNAMPRKLKCKLDINGNTITDVKMLTYSSDWSGDITIGQVVSSYITATIPTPNFSLTGANVVHSMSVSGAAGNLFVGTLDKCNINSSNKIVYEANRTWYLKIAPVVQGKTYYTSEGKLYGFFSDYPEIGSTTVGNRYNSEIGTFTAPITGYVAIRYPASVSTAILNAWDAIGQYTVDKNSVRTRQGYTSFSAYDKLHDTVNTYTANASYAENLQGLCNDVCNQIGIGTVANLGNIGATAVEKASLNGYTLRDVLGFVAAVCGKNAYLDASNNLVLKWFSNTSYTADGTRANIPYVGENNCTVQRIICQGADGTYSYGSGEGIYFTCPIITQANQANILSYLHDELAGFSYRKADVDIPYGNYGLQSGDVITVSTTGSNLNVPIMANSWTYDGGLSSAVSAYGVSDYSGTANNAERSVSSRRVQAVMENKQTIKRENQQYTRVQQDIADAAEVITGASGGYIKINFDSSTGETAAIYVMDQPSIEQALNVWVFNQGGIGHMARSSTSVPFNPATDVNIAINMRGEILAEYIGGQKISGVALESTEETTNAAQVLISGGAVELNQLYNDVVTHIGRIRSRLRTGPDTVNTLAIECEDGYNITIGKTGSSKLVYISDPQGSETFRFYDDVKFFDDILLNNIYDPSGTGNKSLLAKIQELEQRIEALENA